MASMYNRPGTGSTGGMGKYSALCVPESVAKMHKLKENKPKNNINILQYKIGSNKHPLVASGDLEIGDRDWRLNWFEHRNVGPDQKTMMCLKRTYGKPCAACEAREDLKAQGYSNDAPEVKALSSTERDAFVVQSIDIETQEATIEVLNQSSFLFTKKLLIAVENDDMVSDYESGEVEFAEFGTDGRTVSFSYLVEGTGRNKKTTFDGVTFKARTNPKMIPDISLLDEVPSLDTFLKVCTVAEFTAAFNAEPIAKEEEEEVEEEAPAPKKPTPSPAKPATPPPAAKKAPVAPVEDPDDVPVISADPDEPVEKPAPAKKAPVAPVAEDVDDDTPLCPVKAKGGIFGQTADCYPRCISCPHYEKCCVANG